MSSFGGRSKDEHLEVHAAMSQLNLEGYTDGINRLHKTPNTVPVIDAGSYSSLHLAERNYYN